MESVVIAHELVHSIHKNKKPGMILKLDYEKAYDRVNLDFLFEILETRGFGDKIIGWIKKLVLGGSVGVCVNGNESNFFRTGKGLRQGDPLSPLLFNLVGDTLTKMLEKAADSNLIKGLLTDFRKEGIVSLQYADDTIVFSSVEEKYVRNLKATLMVFEQLSGMRINFSKSEFIPFNVDEETAHSIALTLSCPRGELAMKYLGVPLHFDKLRKEDVQPILDKMILRIAGWRGKLLNYSSRVVLITTCLSSIPVYLLFLS